MRQRLRLALLRLCGVMLRRLVPSARAVATHAPRILVIRPDHLGDVLLSRPGIDALAAALPEARITIAVGPWGRDALGPGRPDRGVVTLPFPGFARRRGGRLMPYILLARTALSWRRTHHYDMAVMLRPDHWWGALLAALAGIPVRVGYETPETRPFLTVALARVPGRHAVEEAMALVDAAARCAGSPAGAINAPPSLPASATARDRARVHALLAGYGVEEGEPLLVLHPGSGSSLKAWSLDNFAAAGTTLAGALGARVVITGSAHERGMAQTLCDLLPGGALNLAGALTWGEVEALLARATLVVGVDSGPLHLAVAAGTPSVALFGPADPAQFTPWGPAARHRLVMADLPCRPCRRLDYCAIEPDGIGPPPCMRAIEPAAVLDAARGALAGGTLTTKTLRYGVVTENYGGP